MVDNEIIILLDLNYTLVGNSKVNKYTRPWEKKIKKEKYREWLVNLIQDKYTILITARPDYQKEVTMTSITSKLDGWLPQEAYFNELDQRPPTCKDRILNQYVFPTHGREAQYLALESNPSTKKMYANYNIPSTSITNQTTDEKYIKRIMENEEARRRLLNKQGIFKANTFKNNLDPGQTQLTDY